MACLRRRQCKAHGTIPLIKFPHATTTEKIYTDQGKMLPVQVSSSSSILPPAESLVIANVCDCPLHSGAYRKEQLVGRGATGDIFMAWRGSGQVALKQIYASDAALMKEMLQLAQQYQRLLHPHVIRYDDCFTHVDEHDAHFVVIAMPFFPHGDITALLQRTTRLEESLILQIGSQVADALYYLHTMQPSSIVHRDVKPENLLWDGANVVLTDLETACFPSANLCLGTTGSYPYQSPEQIDHGLTSEKSDIWGLGCVLFVMAVMPSFPDIMHSEVRRSDFSQWLTRSVEGRRYSSAFATTLLMMLKMEPWNRPSARQVRDRFWQLMESTT